MEIVVQLYGFFGNNNLFSQSATLPLYLFGFFVCQIIFYLRTIFQPWIFLVQGFSLNFARTLGRAVDKLLHASRVNSHGQFIHIFKTRLKLDCSLLSSVKVYY